MTKRRERLIGVGALVGAFVGVFFAIADWYTIDLGSDAAVVIATAVVGGFLAYALTD